MHLKRFSDFRRMAENSSIMSRSHISVNQHKLNKPCCRSEDNMMSKDQFKIAIKCFISLKFKHLDLNLTF